MAWAATDMGPTSRAPSGRRVLNPDVEPEGLEETLEAGGGDRPGDSDADRFPLVGVPEFQVDADTRCGCARVRRAGVAPRRPGWEGVREGRRGGRWRSSPTLGEPGGFEGSLGRRFLGRDRDLMAVIEQVSQDRRLGDALARQARCDCVERRLRGALAGASRGQRRGIDRVQDRAGEFDKA